MNVKITIVVSNKIYLKALDLVEPFMVSGTHSVVVTKGSENVEMKFECSKSNIDNFRHVMKWAGKYLWVVKKEA